MISAETKHRLGEFLHAVSENERAVETTRQLLAETHTFAPRHLFTALDVSGRGISTSDLIRFLTTMRVYCSSNDAYLIVRQYDSNTDERINYDEFLQVALPATHPSLRELALGRSGYMSYDVEQAFSRLLDREM
jgi:Ca2+-binding EF-hand superfamily protein